MLYHETSPETVSNQSLHTFTKNIVFLHFDKCVNILHRTDGIDMKGSANTDSGAIKIEHDSGGSRNFWTGWFWIFFYSFGGVWGSPGRGGFQKNCKGGRGVRSRLVSPGGGPEDAGRLQGGKILPGLF